MTRLYLNDLRADWSGYSELCARYKTGYTVTWPACSYQLYKTLTVGYLIINRLGHPAAYVTCLFFIDFDSL